jgi:hypothetical protein
MGVKTPFLVAALGFMLLMCLFFIWAITHTR